MKLRTILDAVVVPRVVLAIVPGLVINVAEPPYPNAFTEVIVNT